MAVQQHEQYCFELLICIAAAAVAAIARLLRLGTTIVFC